jgi:hypothetical protein
VSGCVVGLDGAAFFLELRIWREDWFGFGRLGEEERQNVKQFSCAGGSFVERRFGLVWWWWLHHWYQQINILDPVPSYGP